MTEEQALPPLLIPMQVDALFVGPDEAAGPWSDLSVDFRRLDPKRPLADTLAVRPFHDARPLDPGVHLHFRLPAVYTHGKSTGSGDLEMPAIPDRWLVQRWVDGVPSAFGACLLLSNCPDPNGRGWPGYETTGDETRFVTTGFGSLWHFGSSVPLDGTIAAIHPARKPEIRITALGPGDPAFAASYQSCKGMLGYFDDLAGVPRGARINYLVTGWHSKSDRDDLLCSAPSDPEGLRRWLHENGLDIGPSGLAADALPDRAICHGAVLGVTGGAPQGKATEAPAPGNLAVADTAGEALAALVTEEPEDRDRLAALQAGLWNMESRAENLKFDLAARRFRRIGGGTAWVIERNPDPATTHKEAATRSPDTPEHLKRLLAELNRSQQDRDRAEQELDQARRDLFAAWCLNASGRDPSRHRIDEFRRKCASLQGFLETELKPALSLARQATEGALAVYATRDHKRYTLVARTVPAFDIFADPVVAIAHPAVAPNRTRILPDRLPCRIGISRDQLNGTLSELTPDQAKSVHRCLLAEAMAQSASGKDAGLAVHRWQGNPWRPVHAVWEVEWQAEDGSATAKPARFGGHSLLNGASARHFLDQLSDRGLNLGAAQEALAQDVGVAKLAGFMALLDGRRVVPALKPLRGNDQGELRVDPSFADFGAGQGIFSVVPDPGLTGNGGAKGGVLRLTRLGLVGSFGQRIELPVSGVHRSAPPEHRVEPRLFHPARLSPSWLPAGGTDDPLPDALCGWLVPIPADSSICVYASDGHLEGILQIRVGVNAATPASTSAAFWIGDPSRLDEGGTASGPDAVRDPNLRALCRWLLECNTDDLDRFHAEIGKSIMKNLRRPPEEAGDLAALVGRPLALARLRLDLDLLGRPGGDPRLADCRWPVFLGDTEAEDDGLIGAFHLTDQGRIDGARGLAVAWNRKPRSKRGGRPSRFVAQDFELSCGRPLEVAVLFDPRMPVHVTSDFLPRSRIMAPEQASSARRRPRKVFMAGTPVLLRGGQPIVPRPADTYGAWRWHDTAGTRDLRQEANTGPAAAAPIGLVDGWLELDMSRIIYTFTTREALRSVAAGTQVTLEWQLDDPDRIALYAGPERAPIKAWSGGDIPGEWAVTLETTSAFRLVAEKGGETETAELTIKVGDDV